ncbi:hypothetical protein [Ruixingdingia sedimenti]|uniref:Uncharacterized protein n=1 Tax=Ruixingdingia sedimenti TaxID=3073604 RepID=A0ABU1FDA6_9RHOB|nr:hypothetical protein [Xinfangfangia sp. LG-4]MDR5654850.1 hypothetical protein [Xinfangfangia sp. LG-4]
MLSRLTGALLRAFLVMVLIATPALVLPAASADARQIASLIGLFLGALIFVEYASVYPGLIEFRHAPPFNRIRFLSLFLTVFLLAVIVRGQTEPSQLTLGVERVGAAVGMAIDFPYSPVRLATLTLAPDVSQSDIALIRSAAGLAYLVSLLGLSLFVVILKVGGWPGRRGAFNVWVNLPTFDPTAGGDVVDRLERDARINIALGFLLPFLMPAVVKAISGGIGPITQDSPQLLIWAVATWAFLPASLFMRGIAMGRIADMIREKRRMAEAQPGSPAAHATA